jgi:SAM-dependent methyltransferase
MRRSVFFLSLFVLLAGAGASPAPGQSAPKLRPPDVRYEPSTPAIVKAMLELAGVKKGDIVYDLGCGDGRIAISAYKDFGAVRATGIDIDPERIREARENARKAGVGKRVQFRNEDLFLANFRDATVVTLYLYPWVNMKLRPKLLRELKPGTRIVSHSHDMGEWKPEREIQADGDTIYFWTVPATAPKFTDDYRE